MSHTILLADDDAAIRMVLNQALTRAGYEVRPTGNLSTMWNWASRGEGDLLITDVAMPDGNAFDIMPKIKKLRPDLPIVVMSAPAKEIGWRRYGNRVMALWGSAALTSAQHRGSTSRATGRS